MSNEYEAVKQLARAIYERDRGQTEQAIELFEQVVSICKEGDSPTCKYLNRSAHIELYKLYKASERADKAAEYRTKSFKLGIQESELTR
jgi:hypothetical protein